MQALRTLDSVRVRLPAANGGSTRRVQSHLNSSSRVIAAAAAAAAGGVSSCDLIDLSQQQQVAALGALVAVLLQAQARR